MKRTLFLGIVILIFSSSFLFSQSCLPEGITIYSQDVIDDFQLNYPGCTEIEGDVEIKGSTITNLHGLHVLTSIKGDLIFGRMYPGGNPRLVNMGGLDSITYIGGDLKIWNCEYLSSLKGLESLSSLGGSLIIGDLGFGNDSLVSLSGLNNLVTIGGSLIIDGDGSLPNLEGLDNLSTVEGNVYIDSNLDSLSGLKKLTKVKGGFTIYSASWLTNLKGLESLTSIGGTLEIRYNPSLLSLHGFKNLDSIGEDLNIVWNKKLMSLYGFEKLNTLGGDLTIHTNDALTTLEGLCENNSFSIHNLSIVNNTSLTDCDLQCLCDYLSNPGGTVTIHSNGEGCNNPSDIASSCGFDLPCLPFGNYYFFHQNEIDNFKINYPNCTELNGLVEIKGNTVSNLQGINVVTAMNGDVKIRHNNSLEIFTGLDSLRTIGGNFYINNNHVLTSLTGLGQLASVGDGLRVEDNNGLINLDGINSLKDVGGSLRIAINPYLINISGLTKIEAESIGNLSIVYNYSLSECNIESICHYLLDTNAYVSISNNASGCDSKEEVYAACFPCLPDGIIFSTQEEIDSFQVNYPDCNKIKGEVIISGNAIINLNGLNSITQIGNRLWINNNPGLTSLSGLNNLESVGGELKIQNNKSLLSLSGLDSIHAGSISSLNITENDNLSTCDILAVCNYLINPDGTAVINNNTIGCNSQEEVQSACNAFTDEMIFRTQPTISPNPFKHHTIIAFQLKRSGNIKVEIYNQYGRLVEVLFDGHRQMQEQKIIWNAENMATGIYYCVLKTKDGLQIIKMIKLK